MSRDERWDASPASSSVSYFRRVWSRGRAGPRARAQHNFQILNQFLVSVALSINEHSTDEGHSPETSGPLLPFWHF